MMQNVRVAIRAGVTLPKLALEDAAMDEEAELAPASVLKDQAYLTAYIARTMDAYFELPPQALRPDEPPLSERPL